jgi:pantothenate kinase
MDGFHLANQELARLGRADRKGAPDTFDVSGYVALLARLGRRRPGEVVYAPSFDRQLETAIAGSIRVEPATALVVTEGNYLLLDEGDWRQVRPLLDEVWYLDVAVDVRRRRLIERHAAHGRSAAEAERWADGNDARNGLLVDPTRVAADVVVGWNAATGWTVQAARSGRNASA